jgi:hypothetical protein
MLEWFRHTLNILLKNSLKYWEQSFFKWSHCMWISSTNNSEIRKEIIKLVQPDCFWLSSYQEVQFSYLELYEDFLKNVCIQVQGGCVHMYVYKKMYSVDLICHTKKIALWKLKIGINSIIFLYQNQCQIMLQLMRQKMPISIIHSSRSLVAVCTVYIGQGIKLWSTRRN